VILFFAFIAFCQGSRKPCGNSCFRKSKIFACHFWRIRKGWPIILTISDLLCPIQDIAFGGSNGTRLKEIIMQWNEQLTASRF